MPCSTCNGQLTNTAGKHTSGRAWLLHRSAAAALGKDPEEEGLSSTPAPEPVTGPPYRARGAWNSGTPLNEEQTHYWSHRRAQPSPGPSHLPRHLFPAQRESPATEPLFLGSPAPPRGSHYHIQSCTLTNQANPASQPGTSSILLLQGGLMFPWHGLHSPVTRTCTAAGRGTCTHLYHWMGLLPTPSPLCSGPAGTATAITRKSCSRDSQSPQVQKQCFAKMGQRQNTPDAGALLVLLNSFSSQSSTPTPHHHQSNAYFLKGVKQLWSGSSLHTQDSSAHGALGLFISGIYFFPWLSLRRTQDTPDKARHSSGHHPPRT